MINRTHFFSSIKPDWLVLLVCLLSILLVTYPVFDFDLYWHLANGREMITSGHVVDEDRFSYTHPGAAFANHEWLGQIMLYLVWTVFGVYGLLAMKLLLVALTMWSLFRTLCREQTAPAVAALLCVLAVLAGVNRYHERPELFTLFGMAALGMILYGFRAGLLKQRWLWLVPLMLVMWDWLHTALYGVIFLTLFVIGENAKHRIARLYHPTALSADRLAVLNRFFALALLAMLLNPYGLRSYGIFVGYAVGQGNFNQVITEYQPVNWEEFKVFILMLGWTALLALRHWRRTDATHLLLLLFFGAAALRFNRVTSISAIVLAPILAELLRAGMHQTRGNMERRLHVAALTVAAALMLAQGYLVKFGEAEVPPDSDQFHYLKVYDTSFGYKLDESFYPVGAVNFIKQERLEGHLYNSGNLGAYLSYRITPERKIFQYNISVFGDPFYYVRHPDELAKWNIDYAIVDTEAEVDALFPPRDWSAVYHDESAVLMVRRTPQNAVLIREHEAHFFNPAYSRSNLMTRANDPDILPALATEMGDYLAYREDERIASVWANILDQHGELTRLPGISQSLRLSLRYNHAAKLLELAGHARPMSGSPAIQPPDSGIGFIHS
ncbi:MAG: hypothetical protein WA632_09915 [Gallionella sp.]